MFIVFISNKLSFHQNELFIIQFGMIPSVLIGVSELSSEIRVFPFFSSISYIFLHGSWLHLLGNMGYLYIFLEIILKTTLENKIYFVFYCVAV